MAFQLKSVFKAPEASVTTGLAEGAAILAIYANALPTHADIRSANPNNTDVESARKKAAWMGFAIIGLVFIMTRDRNSALIGGASLAGIDFLVKHANGVDPGTGKLVSNTPAAPADNDTAFPLPSYADASDDAGTDY